MEEEEKMREKEESKVLQDKLLSKFDEYEVS